MTYEERRAIIVRSAHDGLGIHDIKVLADTTYSHIKTVLTTDRLYPDLALLAETYAAREAK